MRYYLIAGEASGDLHGAALMKALGKVDPEAAFRYWGGDLMMKEGGSLVRHIRSTSFMGFWEVVKNSGSIIRSLRFCKRDLIEYSPDALILIDYPGFNLRMAKFAKRKGIRVFYYISPKVWAWNQSRVKSIKRYVDHMLTILPFETEFYKRWDYRVDYVGNPVLDAVENRANSVEDFAGFCSRNNLDDRPVIAILAGSRLQEIDACLPVMLSVVNHFPEYQFVIAGAPSIRPDTYNLHTGGSLPVLYNQTYSVLQHCTAAMVVSGTATLESALLGAPIVVCYRGSALSYHIARCFVKVKYISLVNLIMEREVVRELIQHEFNTPNLIDELERILKNDRYMTEMKTGLMELRNRLGAPGASDRAALKIREYLTGKNN